MNKKYRVKLSEEDPGQEHLLLKQEQVEETGITGGFHHFSTNAKTLDHDFLQEGKSNFTQDVEIERRIIFLRS